MDEPATPLSADADRREFLSKYGKLALAAPPAITMLLSTSMVSPAIAQSSGGRRNVDSAVGAIAAAGGGVAGIVGASEGPAAAAGVVPAAAPLPAPPLAPPAEAPAPPPPAFKPAAPWIGERG